MLERLEPYHTDDPEDSS